MKTAKRPIFPNSFEDQNQFQTIQLISKLLAIQHTKFCTQICYLSIFGPTLAPQQSLKHTLRGLNIVCVYRMVVTLVKATIALNIFMFMNFIITHKVTVLCHTIDFFVILNVCETYKDNPVAQKF